MYFFQAILIILTLVAMLILALIYYLRMMVLRTRIGNVVPLVDIQVEPVQPVQPVQPVPIVQEPRNIINYLVGIGIKASVSEFIEYLLEFIY